MNSKLLEKYFKGECSEEEVKEVISWFRNNDDQQDLIKLWRESELEKNFPDSEKVFALITADINKPEHEVSLNKWQIPQTLKPGKQLPGWVFKVAAAFLILLVFGGLYLDRLSSFFITTPETIRVITLPGERKEIILEDGSQVVLNDRSKLTYSVPFSDNKREVSLEGEAFFKIAKDTIRPFRVRSGSLMTQALGTSFNINYRPSQKSIAVALVTGSVRVDHYTGTRNRRLVTLQPGKELVYDTPQEKFYINDFNNQEVLGWEKGILYFKQATLAEVVNRLETWYHVQISLHGKVPDTRSHWSYTGEYTNQSLENVLSGIGFVKSFTFEKKDRNVKIYFN